jgi:multidrug efflux pump subunit AcrB
MMGVEVSEIYSALGKYMGSSYVNDFVDFDRIFQVTIQADGDARSHPEDVMKLSVKNSNGEMVPFSAFTQVCEVMGEPSVSRYNMYTTASLTATPAAGVSSSEGIAAMEQIVKETLGKRYSYAWTGMAYQETHAGVTISVVFIFAIIMTILVLAAQYESWRDPIAVCLAMPIALLGTLLGVIIMRQSVSIYTQIGLILLLGMAAKNAILIVEFASDFIKQGVAVKNAAYDAGMIRFRPIMMTAMAFIFGVMPMLFATGAGANSRIQLGTAIVFGMLMNAFIGTTFVPTFFLLLARRK